MDRLKNKRVAGAHLDLPDIDSEAKEYLQEGALPIILPTFDNDFRDEHLLTKRHHRSLKVIEKLEPRLHGISNRRIRRGMLTMLLGGWRWLGFDFQNPHHGRNIGSH